MYKSKYKFNKLRANTARLIVDKKSSKPSLGLRRAYDSSVSDFGYNGHGFIRNDFSRLVEENDRMAYAAAMSAMQREFGESLPEDMTFEQAVAQIRPRWVQSPAELDRFELYLIDNALDYYKKLKSDLDEKALQESIAKAKEKQLQQDPSTQIHETN